MIEIPGLIVGAEALGISLVPRWQAPFSRLRPDDLSRFALVGWGSYGIGRKYEDCPDFTGKPDYLNIDVEPTDFLSFSHKINTDCQDYLVFCPEPFLDNNNYLRKMRMITRLALNQYFGLLSENEFDNFPCQESTIGETLVGFIKHECHEWKKLCHELSFGFMIEQPGIYCLWSHRGPTSRTNLN